MTATKPLNTNVGIELLHDPRQNKSTAFTLAERQELGLIGLLPSGVDTEDIQVRRALQQIGDKPTDLERYIYLVGLLDTDETLFYKVAMSDPARFLPVLYDPTVGEACLKFGHIFRRPRGMYLSLKDKGNMRAVLKNWPEKDVRVICITSGERILGLGDLGLRQPRVSITERDELVDEFVQAVQEVFPGCCIHFEDWAGVDAERLLKRYRDKVSCYNDDIQGTGAVAVAGILNALRITGGRLSDQRILFLGAGSAGIGIADMIASAMTLEGLTLDQARSRISHFDIKGLLEPSRTDLFEFQKPYAHPHTPSRDFVSVVDDLKQ